MDNVMAPVLADVTVKGAKRKAVIYGSKTGLTYILDRVTGAPLIGITEKAVPQEPAQKTWPTQPYPEGDPVVPICPDTTGKGPGRAPPNYVTGCLFTPHTDKQVITAPGTGGAADWSQQSFDPLTGLLYIPAGIVNSAHSIPTAGIGFRPPGEERSGLIVAKNPSTNRNRLAAGDTLGLAHGNGILTTAGGVMFVGQPDGYLLGLDIKDGRELWRFQTGAGAHTSPITYSIDGEQYVAVFAGGNGIPYNSPRGDFLWAFKVGGSVAPAPVPTPPPTRQPVFGTPVAGSAVNFTVTLGRTWNANQEGGQRHGIQHGQRHGAPCHDGPRRDGGHIPQPAGQTPPTVAPANTSRGCSKSGRSSPASPPRTPSRTRASSSSTTAPIPRRLGRSSFNRFNLVPGAKHGLSGPKS